MKGLFFSADNGTTVNELWTSDGTPNGTLLLQDIRSGSGSSNPANLTHVNGKLIFTADDGVHGEEPWRLVLPQSPNRPPMAEAGGPYDLLPDELFNEFDATGSFDPDVAAWDRIVRYEWDLNGDGVFDYIFDEPPGGGPALSKLHVDRPALEELVGFGQHQLRLRVTDTHGASQLDISTLSVFGSLPSVSFVNTASSGSEASSPASIAVSLFPFQPSDQTVTVAYAVTGGTATGGGADYTVTHGTLTFAPGEITKTISVAIENDSLDESNETIQVRLSSPTNALLGSKAIHTYTIIDDDPKPTVSFPAADSSGDESASTSHLGVSLSVASGQTVTVSYQATTGTATGGGVDYTLANGILTFAPGETSKTIVLAVEDDLLNEANETVNVTLSGPVNALLGGIAVHTYTVLDNDALPTVNFTAASSTGGEAITSATLAVALTPPSGQAVTVDYAVVGGTASASGELRQRVQELDGR
jgi:ELWxxDGT repeat protein